MALTGSEVTYVQGIAQNGQLSAQTEQVSVTQFTNFEGSMYLATQQSFTTTTAGQVNFANLNGSAPQSFTLAAGGVYVFDIYLTVTTTTANGLILKFGGTATATTLSADTWAYDTTTVAAQSNITALSSNLLSYKTMALTTINVTGTIICNAGGTFYLEAAQNTASGTSYINAGSNFWIDRIA